MSRVKLAFLLFPLAPVAMLVVFASALGPIKEALGIIPTALILSYGWSMITGAIAFLAMRASGHDNLLVCAIAGGVCGALYFVIPFSLSGFPLSTLQYDSYLWVALLATLGAIGGVCFRWISGPFIAKGGVVPMPNHSPDPTLASGTPPAGQESRHR